VTKRRTARQTRVLLTFTGFHDPFHPGPVSGLEQEGPILSLVRSFPLEEVILFSTPRTTDLTTGTEKALRERHHELKTEIRHLAIDDPTDYLAILTRLRDEFTTLSKDRGNAVYFVATASGTPQMHACWMLLVASGEIPGRLLHARPPQFATEHKPAVTEIDLSRPEFPTIRSRLWASIPPLDDGASEPAEVIERLGIIGDHPAITQAFETATLLARSDVSVLILGESGTGKEKTASLIHQLSQRASQPFIALNCAAISACVGEYRSVIDDFRRTAELRVLAACL
jgi:sigma54-dependent transcription regulator